MSDLSGATPASGDPVNTVAYRAARAAAIGLGVLVALAFAALVIGFIIRLKGGGETRPAPDSPRIYQLSAGAKIFDMKVDSGHLILRIRTKRGEEIQIIDESSGKVVSRMIVPK